MTTGIDDGVLDHDHLNELAELGPDFVLELRDLWLETAGDYLTAMASAIPADGRDALCDAAHALRGSSATVGAIALPTACQQIEDLARSGAGAAELEASLAIVHAEYERLLAALAIVVA